MFEMPQSLMLFNKQPRWTLGKMMAVIRIPYKELRLAVLSIIFGKQNLVLNEVNSSKDIWVLTMLSYVQ